MRVIVVGLCCLLLAAACTFGATSSATRDAGQVAGSPARAAPVAASTPLSTSVVTRATARPQRPSPIASPSPTAATLDGMELTSAWFVDARHGWVIGQRCYPAPTSTPNAAGQVVPPPPPACQGAIERTSDGGSVWIDQSLGDSRFIPKTIQFVDPSHGWVLATTAPSCGETACQSEILATSDGGQHWAADFHTGPNTPSLLVQGQPVSARSVALTSLAMTSDHEGWALGSACASANGQDCQPQGAFTACATPDTRICQPVLYTTQDGHTWGQVALPSGSNGSRLAALAHPTATDGWIAGIGLGGSILVTHDGGVSWQTLPHPAANRFAWKQYLFFRSASQGWLLVGGEPGAGQERKAVYATADGGRTWTLLAGGLGSDLPNGLGTSGYVGPIVFSTARDGWIASFRGGLLHSSDGGRTWRPVPSISCGDLTCGAVTFVDPEIGWVLSGRGLWLTTDGGQGWRQLTVPHVDSSA